MTKPVMWTTNDGVTLQIGEMGDSHLLNTIQYLRRTHRARCWALARSAGRYAMTAPDGAADAAMQAEEALLALAESPYCMDEPFGRDLTLDEAVAKLEPRHTTMLREAKRRSLVVPPLKGGIE